MSIWGIIWNYVKGIFTSASGTDGIISYALGKLNSFLAKDDIAGRVKEAYTLADSVSTTLHKYEDWCPAKWRTSFDHILAAVDCICDTFEDGVVDEDEAKKCITQFRVAYADWVAED